MINLVYKLLDQISKNSFIVNISHVLYVFNLYDVILRNRSYQQMTKLYKKYKTVENISVFLSLFQYLLEAPPESGGNNGL